MVNRTGKIPVALGTVLSLIVCVGTALVGLIALGGCTVRAQGFAAAISGAVRDTSGAAIPGVTITAKHLETGLTRAVEVDATGNYRIASLPVGEYELSAEAM